MAVASAFMQQSRFDEAEAIFRPLLERQRRVLGDEDPLTLNTMNEMSVMYHRQARYIEALPLVENSWRVLRKLLGETAPRTLISQGNLADTLGKLRRYGEAEHHYSSAIEGQQRVLGPDHPMTRRTIAKLVAMYEDWGQPDKSGPMARKAADGTITQAVNGRRRNGVAQTFSSPTWLHRDRDSVYSASVPASSGGHGHRQSDLSPGESLAESVRGTRDRLDPSRMPGSHDRAQSSASAMRPRDLQPVLPVAGTTLKAGLFAHPPGVRLECGCGTIVPFEPFRQTVQQYLRHGDIPKGSPAEHSHFNQGSGSHSEAGARGRTSLSSAHREPVVHVCVRAAPRDSEFKGFAP